MHFSIVETTLIGLVELNQFHVEAMIIQIDYN